jgi:hypothetical protein
MPVCKIGAVTGETRGAIKRTEGDSVVETATAAVLAS